MLNVILEAIIAAFALGIVTAGDAVCLDGRSPDRTVWAVGGLTGLVGLALTWHLPGAGWLWLWMAATQQLATHWALDNLLFPFD